MEYDLVVVGSGLFGLTVAQQAAERWGIRVALLEKRSHIGGNAYSEIDPETGIEVHRYGAHIFHTRSEPVWDYVNRFTEFTNYEHHVWATVRGTVYPLPVNLATINQFFNAAYSPDEARELIANQASEGAKATKKNFETKGISLVGKPLFDAFYRGYTAKQWQTSPEELPASIVSRLPVRYNYDSRYFSDPHQGMPKDGYAAWLSRMAESDLIHVYLETDFLEPGHPFSKDEVLGTTPIVYTGPLDRYFDRALGSLSWRTVDFEVSRPSTGDYQGCAVMNYGDIEVPWTRIIEFRHFHPERTYSGDSTIIFREFSRFAGEGDEPYYPVNAPGDREKLLAYRELARKEPQVFFGGRLGSYQYLDMDMAIASAFTLLDGKLTDLFGVSGAPE